MRQNDIKELLAQQMELLHKKSEDATAMELAALSEAMSMIANSFLINYSE